MAKRNVIWTRTADLQFVGILEYWVKRNKSNRYAKKLLKLVSERTKQIAENPLIYKATDFKNVRVTSLGNFCIYYKVFNEEIIITAFWDNRQDPKNLLENITRQKNYWQQCIKRHATHRRLHKPLAASERTNLQH